MGIGFQEMMIILLIAVLLFGTGRLKSIGGDLGAAIKGFKTSLKDDDKEEEEGRCAESPTILEKPASPNPPTLPAE